VFCLDAKRAQFSPGGFAEVRRRGSHIVMQKSLDNGTITVPVPDHDELRAETLRAIIRQSGVIRSEFETD